MVSPSAGREADPGRRAVAPAPDPGPTRAHLPRGGTIASLAAPPLRTSRQHLLHLILDYLILDLLIRREAFMDPTLDCLVAAGNNFQTDVKLE